jgi:hypothetical protein
MAKFSILACTIVVCSLMLVYSSLQAQSQKIQAQQLVDSTVKKNTDIAGLEVSAIPPVRPPVRQSQQQKLRNWERSATKMSSPP